MNTAPHVSTDAVVVFQQVTKRFRDAKALHDVTLAIPRGAVVGLVGRNGSGKSTLLQHITGLLLPTSGACTTFGTDVRQLDAAELCRIGVVAQHGTLLEWMTAWQLIRHVSTFYPRWDTVLERALTERLGIALDTRIGTMSPGNVQRLSLLLALCHRPELLLLDEPLSDLDPVARRDVAHLLMERVEADRCTIVISSHLLHDIEPLVNRIVCLEQGRVTADDELDALKERHGLGLEALFLMLQQQRHAHDVVER
jgi:ABC-2 type transport system ATP-binding protein